MPGSRDRMAGSVCSGERSMSSAVMTVVEAPVMPAPPTAMPPIVPDGGAVGCSGRRHVAAAGAPVPPGPATDARQARIGHIDLRQRHVLRMTAPHAADDRSAASAAAPVRPIVAGRSPHRTILRCSGHAGASGEHTRREGHANTHTPLATAKSPSHAGQRRSRL